MKETETNWVLLAIVIVIVLVFVAHSLAPPPKARRPQRIQVVNNFPKVSLTLTNSNAPPVPVN